MTFDPPKPLYTGKFLSLLKRGRWEYASRTKATGVVAVVALHEDGRVVLVEQHRPAVAASVVEIPAGLAGDEDDAESLLAAAKRELEEETGYVAERWVQLTTACPSPGLTDELITFFLAQGLRKNGEGGGVAGESIVVHEVSYEHLSERLDAARRDGRQIDMKVLAGLYVARSYIQGVSS